MSELTMTSNQPYLLKAFFDWIVDNELTPHLVVDAFLPPQHHIQAPEVVTQIWSVGQNSHQFQGPPGTE